MAFGVKSSDFGGPSQAAAMPISYIKPDLKSRLVWEYSKRHAKLNFAIPNVGKLSLEVEATLPGAGDSQSETDRKELAARHARLLVRNFARALEEIPPGEEPNVG